MSRASSNPWRWRCALCDGFGYSDSDDSAVADFYRHYSAKHKETT